MNEKQKKILMIGIGVIVLMCLIPPWNVSVTYKSQKMSRPTGYSLIFTPPAFKGKYAIVSIGFDRLFVQFIAAAFVTAGGIYYFKDNSPADQ